MLQLFLKPCDSVVNFKNNVIVKLFSREGRKFYFFIHDLTGLWPGQLDIYRLAFTHKSAAYRHGSAVDGHNERLEYLGDALLSAIVAEFLYHKFPQRDEGFLTKTRSRVISRSSLNRIALEMNLNRYIQASTPKPLEQTHVLGDTLEALIGAVYLDKGYLRTTRFVVAKILVPYVDFQELIQEDTNYKSLLIEWGHKNKVEIEFLTDEKHNASESEFVAEAFVNEVSMGRGKALSKKEAQQKAAAAALKALTDSEFCASGES